MSFRQICRKLTIKPIVSIDQLAPVLSAEKKNRSNYRNMTVHARIGKSESKWTEEMSAAMEVKPACVMVAIAFSYQKTEDQESAAGNG